MREWCRIDRVIPLGRRVSELTLIAALFSFLAMAVQAGSRPNIVFIISDDQTWTDYSFMGHKHIETANIDLLAAQSLTFTHGYVPSSLCCPSLATMITGLCAFCNNANASSKLSAGGWISAAVTRPSGRPAVASPSAMTF